MRWTATAGRTGARAKPEALLERLREKASFRRTARPVSLTLRLALVAGLGAGVVFVLTGLLLTSLFRATIERSFDARLETLQAAIVGAVFTPSGAEFENAFRVSEPNFALPLSGWYWQIRGLGDEPLLVASPSLFAEVLRLPEPATEGGAVTAPGPGGNAVRALVRVITAPDGERYELTVTGDAEALAREVAVFSRTVALVLGALALLLALSIIFLLRWGLAPLKDLRVALTRIAAGKQRLIGADYPRELAPLVEELNALIQSNEAIIARARTQAGNLAHGLKTPIAVLVNEAGGRDTPLAEAVRAQTSAMRDQIDHHLSRARLAANVGRIGAATELRPVVEDLLRVMRKLAPDTTFDLEAAEGGLRFRGERHDLEEMAGNLLENAARFARARVLVRIEEEPSAARIALSIEDDGPGLTREEGARALKRGVRLDETTPGSGLGLSIVNDLVTSYGGELKLAQSELGGLRATLRLPRAAA